MWRDTATEAGSWNARGSTFGYERTMVGGSINFMALDFFQPAPEQQNVVLIDAATLE